MKNYITQPLSSAPGGIYVKGTGAMMCSSNGQCFTTYFVGNEFELVNTAGVNAFYGEISYQSLIGVIQDFNPQDSVLRCYSWPGQPCTSPAASSNLPQGVPIQASLNVVPYATVQAHYENPDGTPRSLISGAESWSGFTYADYQSNTQNPATCAQTSTGSTPAYATAVYVTNVPFGGSVGTQSAVVIDEFEKGPNIALNHMERYYYVPIYGQVRSGAEQYDVNTGVYDLNISGQPGPDNTVYNEYKTPSTLPYNKVDCPQDSGL